MGSLEDRLRRLEGRIRPREPAAEEHARQAIADLDRLARIVRDSGAEFDNLLAQVKEHHPHLSPYHAQLEAKRLLILRSGPDGPRLWEYLKSALDGDRKPAIP